MNSEIVYKFYLVPDTNLYLFINQKVDREIDYIKVLSCRFQKKNNFV